MTDSQSTSHRISNSFLCVFNLGQIHSSSTYPHLPQSCSVSLDSIPSHFNSVASHIRSAPFCPSLPSRSIIADSIRLVEFFRSEKIPLHQRNNVLVIVLTAPTPLYDQSPASPSSTEAPSTYTEIIAVPPYIGRKYSATLDGEESSEGVLTNITFRK